MSNKYKPKKVYSMLDLLLICLLVWVGVIVSAAFYGDYIIRVVKFVIGG